MVNNCSTVTLDFEVSHVRDRSMSLTIETDHDVKHFDQLPSGRFKHTVDIKFPSKFNIIVSGKGANDTLIDQDGNIIGDMYIKLNRLSVDGILCSTNYVHELVNCTTNGDRVQTNYWGFNGTIKLDFSHSNVVFWAMNHSRRF
jgi:hypothetical protein